MKKYELTQVQGKNVLIDISQLFREEVLYVNATSLAKQFGKRIHKYFELDGTKEYHEALKEEILNTPKKGELELLKTSKGRYGGTYIHSLAIVHFLRWLDVRFAVKCDLFIRNTIQEAHDEAVAAKATIKANEQNLNWGILREHGKATRKAETDMIQYFCVYAQKQRGEPYKKNKCPYYILLSKLPYEVLGIKKPKGKRNQLPEPILAEVERIENIMLQLIGEVIADELEYHEAFRVIKREVAAAV